MTTEQWRHFMATLLILPPLAGKTPVADSRWIGHRLMQGSGALRLTKVNERYLAIPFRIRNRILKAPLNIQDPGSPIF